MFFFIAGIHPKTVNLDEQPRLCPSCGLYQARLKRVDSYVSVFFIPVFRVKQGQPFLQCQRCGAISNESGGPFPASRQGVTPTCPHCGRAVEPAFQFCPFCGGSIK